MRTDTVASRGVCNLAAFDESLNVCRFVSADHAQSATGIYERNFAVGGQMKKVAHRDRECFGSLFKCQQTRDKPRSGSIFFHASMPA